MAAVSLSKHKYMEKIELTPNKIVKDSVTIWQDPGPDVDVVMDLKALTFRPESVGQIATFHVLDRLFMDEAVAALKNWHSCLKKGGILYVVTDDFEYIARAFTGGDIDIDTFNRNHSHASQFDRQSLCNMIIDAGFAEANMRIWFDEVPGVFPRKHYELVIEATK